VISRLLNLLVLMAMLAAGGTAMAQGSPLGGLSAQLSQAEADIRAVDRALDSRADATAQKQLRSKAVAAQQSSADAVRRLGEQLSLIEARVAGLGAETAGTQEDPVIRRQRATLAQQRSAIDAAIKRGGLAGVEATQLIVEIDRGQAEEFSQTISARVYSPLTPAFWRAVLASTPRDVRRIALFSSQGVAQIRAAWRGSLPWQALLGAILAVFFLFPARLFARRFGQRYLIEGAPGHRLRRSGSALWRVLIGTLAPILAASSFAQGLRWAGLLPERWSGLFDAAIVAAGFTGFTASVTGAVLMRGQSSWRIASMDDDTASRLRPLSWLLAVTSGVGIVWTSFNTMVGASRAALVATEATQALLHLLLVGAFLLVLGRLRAARADDDDAGSQSTTAGLGVMTLVLWLLLLGATVALLAGYVGFTLFIGQFIAWTIVLGSALYLTMAAADDVATTVFSRTSHLGVVMTRALGIRGSMVAQFGLLLSGVLRIALVVVALGMWMTPFGTGGTIGTIFGRLGTLAQGVDIGGVSISPGAILRGIVVLLIGLGLVRAFMGWLEGRYLPATDLDGSGRNSISLIARYVGIALAAIWALASLGIGIERVALLLSALSVGIGFGLQAITQNFVSGLILLAERPIKIGDLVRVGNDEGDVKRISVRSTEIELADHSTLIVPNSELITKTVLNKTLGGNQGRIQIQFSVPLLTDPQRVRRIALDAISEEGNVLEEPAPAVFIDGLSDGRVLFNCLAHVSSPRDVYRARSNILMTLLGRFREEHIALGTVPAEAAPAVPMPKQPQHDAS
jgi:potassium efflux system protein